MLNMLLRGAALRSWIIRVSVLVPRVLLAAQPCLADLLQMAKMGCSVPAEATGEL